MRDVAVARWKELERQAWDQEKVAVLDIDAVAFSTICLRAE